VLAAAPAPLGAPVPRGRPWAVRVPAAPPATAGNVRLLRLAFTPMAKTALQMLHRALTPASGILRDPPVDGGTVGTGDVHRSILTAVLGIPPGSLLAIAALPAVHTNTEPGRVLA